MKITYEIIEIEGRTPVIKATDENGLIRFIPMDESNSDYQRYLNPKAEQSTPMVTDEADSL
jgi:hypothetical protein